MSKCFSSRYLYSAFCRAYYNGRGNITQPEAEIQCMLHCRLQTLEMKNKISKHFPFCSYNIAMAAMAGGKFSH